MARGKHAASAAKRRAESAEEQLDRLIPKLTDAERLAKRYRSEAEQAPVLRRRIDELRAAVGVPVAEHQAAVDELTAKAAATAKQLEEDLVTVFNTLAARIPRDRDEEWLNARFVSALQRLPPAASEKLLTDLGMERVFRRYLLNGGEGIAHKISSENRKDALLASGVSMAAGYGHDQIPNTLIKPRSHADVLRPPEAELEDDIVNSDDTDDG